jgi:hypothetical protein
LFDPLSPTADAAVALLTRLSATAAGAAAYRDVEVAGEEASLRGTRFPIMGLGGPVMSRLVVAGGFNSYLSRTFSVSTRDSVDLRGEREAFTDEVTSEGGVVDIRVGAAWRANSRISVGAALHALTGSTRARAVRRFDDSLTYQPAGEEDRPRYDGIGGSAGVLLDLAPGLQLAGYLRADTRLRYKTRDTIGTYDLPLTWSAGARWQPGSRTAIAASVQATSWSDAAGIGGHDTFAWSFGVELGGSAFPLRAGVRGGQMPFGPGPDAPKEFGASLGLGFQFSGGRGIVDVGVERLQRKGGGLEERTWSFLLGITVRP